MASFVSRGPILLKKKKRQNFQYLTQNPWTNATFRSGCFYTLKWLVLTKKHGLTPLEKCKMFDFSKWMFLYSKMASFLYKRPQNTFFWPFLLKKKKGQSFLFLTKNHARTPLKKCKILNFLNSLLI